MAPITLQTVDAPSDPLSLEDVDPVKHPNAFWKTVANGSTIYVVVAPSLSLITDGNGGSRLYLSVFPQNVPNAQWYLYDKRFTIPKVLEQFKGKSVGFYTTRF